MSVLAQSQVMLRQPILRRAAPVTHVAPSKLLCIVYTNNMAPLLYPPGSTCTLLTSAVMMCASAPAYESAVQAPAPVRRAHLPAMRVLHSAARWLRHCRSPPSWKWKPSRCTQPDPKHSHRSCKLARTFELMHECEPRQRHSVASFHAVPIVADGGIYPCVASTSACGAPVRCRPSAAPTLSYVSVWAESHACHKIGRVARWPDRASHPSDVRHNRITATVVQLVCQR
jgi:hypothetical protein